MMTKLSVNCLPALVSLEMSELYKMGLGADALRQQVLDDLALAQRLTRVLAALEASGQGSDEPTVTGRFAAPRHPVNQEERHHEGNRSRHVPRRATRTR